MKFSRQAAIVNRLVDGLMSIGKKKITKKFEEFIAIDQIKGTFNCKMVYEGQTY
jgi:hypothetical protein